MYKKQFVALIVLCGVLFSGFANIVKADASDVSVTLCDNSQKEFMLDAGVEKDFCFILNNKSSKDYTISYGFTESIINDIGRQLCNGGISADNPFAAIFTDPKSKDIEIGSGERKEIKEKIIIPMGMTGTIYGCISYSVKGSTHITTGSMFSVLISRTIPIKIFVGKMADIKNDLQLIANPGGAYTTNNKIKATLDKDGKLQLSFLLENKGNIEQNVVISGTVSNIMGLEKTFTIPAKKIGVGSKNEFVGNAGILPFYKGVFSVDVSIESTPSFGFKTSGLDPETTKATTQTTTGTIYIFSWISIVIIIVIILIIIKLLPFKLFRKKEQG